MVSLYIAANRLNFGIRQIWSYWKCKVVALSGICQVQAGMEEIARKSLQPWGGSKGGKHSKGKGKSKLMKNETSSTTREALNSKLDLAQTSHDKAQGLGDSKEKSPDPRVKASSRYTDSIEDGSSGCISHSSNEGSSAPYSTILRATAQREIGADWALIEEDLYYAWK